MVAVEHWSASRFMLFDQCPGLYRQRYVEHVALEPTEALSFGKSVHLGLEAHYLGHDGERAFRTAWKGYCLESPGYDSRLAGVGLNLLDQVFELQLEGTPERDFSLDTPELNANIVGAIDLWGPGRIYDFKTTAGKWSALRAEAEVWQPVLYTWAYWDQTDVLPDFEYIVLNRATGTLSRFLRHWEPDGYREQMDLAWARMRTISTCVAADVLDCHGDHGFCPECGDRWGHDHVCRGAAERIRLRAD